MPPKWCRAVAPYDPIRGSGRNLPDDGGAAASREGSSCSAPETLQDLGIRWGPGDVPRRTKGKWCEKETMPPRGAGAQRTARHDRLCKEIIDYVEVQGACTAADIAHHLSNERRMRNHGLTARKIGFFIPRYVAEITFELDPNSGKRIYSLAA